MNDFAEVVDNPEARLFLVKKKPNEKIRLDVESEIVYSYKGFDYYTVDLKNTPNEKLTAVLEECELIEKSCWDAQENFIDYAKKRDLLTYAMHNGKMVGFQIASYWIMDNVFIFDLDETMVLKQFRGNGLAMTLSGINCRTFVIRIRKIKSIRKMTFVSLTPNMRLINLLDKIRYIVRFLDNTFNPSQRLMKIHDYLIENKGVVLVHQDYPFFLKNIFPGSLKPADHSDRTSQRIKKMIPPGLDFHGRGDAFLFLSCFDKVRLFPVMLVLMIQAMGFRVLFSKNIGLFSKNKYSHAYKYLALDKSIRIERRKTDRRKNNQNGILIDGILVDRRKLERRSVVFD